MKWLRIAMPAMCLKLFFVNHLASELAYELFYLAGWILETNHGQWIAVAHLDGPQQLQLDASWRADMLPFRY